ncbi:ank rep region domain-containing protein [Citrus sinensis]|uniref:Ank rep region domain-containing protein n=2 Tax=Citrus sinensis TaxID=2711 RepID=A0ACB8L1U2_CITSI|nr:ank rep region domain-containing protein [Citrus sinensis]KAH9767235.1 ank rep region domain-containing protein [Citrus sinensis]
MERLLAVSEQEVLINFTLNSKCRANVRLISLCATSPVAFKVQTSSPHKFLVNPPSGLVQPLAQTTLQIILKPQSQIPPTFPRSPSDRFLIKATVFGSADSVNSLCVTLPDGSTQDVKFKIAFVGPFLLRHAVSNGDFNAVKSILKRQKMILAGLSSAEAESLYRVATELAANSEDMVSLLLRAGLSIEIDERVKTKDGWSELHVAAAFGRTEEISSLVRMKKYESLDCRDKEGRTPLHLAVNKTSIGCAKVLLESGADKEAKGKDGKTSLHNAAANGDRRMVEMLIEMGADPTIKDDRGRSCFDVARDKGHIEVLEVLQRGEAVLTAARRGELEGLESLLDKGASTNYCDQYGLTPLHIAAIKGHKHVVLLLIEFGADVECQDNEGHAPLHLAVEGGSIETVEVLLDNGANANARSRSGATPLYMAQAMGYDGISQLLMNRGASASLPQSSMLATVLED